MSKVALYNREGSSVGEIEINDEIFKKQINESLMHQAVLVHLSARRRGTHSVKTRAMVSGGGRKPWRQKGTGRARVGSSRNPVWRGGGVAFGPQPRSYKIQMPKKMRRLALLSALSQKVAEGNMMVVEEMAFETPQTKEMARVLNNLSAANALLVLEKENENAFLSARNLPKVEAAGVTGIDTYRVVSHEKLVLTKDALASLEEVLS